MIGSSFFSQEIRKTRKNTIFKKPNFIANPGVRVTSVGFIYSEFELVIQIKLPILVIKLVHHEHECSFQELSRIVWPDSEAVEGIFWAKLMKYSWCLVKRTC